MTGTRRTQLAEQHGRAGTAGLGRWSGPVVSRARGRPGRRTVPGHVGGHR
jgi:hypothetical protein